MEDLFEIKKTHLNADEIHQLMTLAVQINTTCDESYERPMVFIRYSPHTQRVDVDIHNQGWTDDESTHYPDASWTLYICGNLYNNVKYIECKSYLEKMLETVKEQRLRASIAKKQAEEKDYDIPETADRMEFVTNE